VCSSDSTAVPLLHGDHRFLHVSDNLDMRSVIKLPTRSRLIGAPWAMQFWATANGEPGRLVQTLTGAILGCGGWVLSRGASDDGAVNMAFEFERQVCEDIYSVLVAAGLNLCSLGHLRMTELCQCTRLNTAVCGNEIVSIELEVQTLSGEPHARGSKSQP
jgi:hypothetical protein